MRKLLKRLIAALRSQRSLQDIESAQEEPALSKSAPVLRGRLPSKEEDSNSVVVEVELVPAVTMRVFRAATQEWKDI